METARLAQSPPLVSHVTLMTFLCGRDRTGRDLGGQGALRCDLANSSRRPHPAVRPGVSPRRPALRPPVGAGPSGATGIGRTSSC